MQYLNAVLNTYLEKKRHTYWHIIATGVVDHGDGGGSVGAVVRLNVSYRYTPNCVESGILFFSSLFVRFQLLISNALVAPVYLNV